jgi:MFS family permease
MRQRSKPRTLLSPAQNHGGKWIRIVSRPMTVSANRIAPWYVAYLILGLLTSGMLPFLLPLVVESMSHQLGTVAYVSGAYNLGLLPTPLLGRLAERAQLYRPLFFGAFVVLALAFAAFPHVSSLRAWFVLALLIGVATGAAATVATLFVVDFTPRREWEPRIGWLQSFNGAGQLAGLLLAGAFAQGTFVAGFTLAAGLAVVAVLVSRIGLPQEVSKRIGADRLGHVPVQSLLRPMQLGPALGGLLHQSHYLQWAGLRSLRTAMRGRFGRFLIAWSAYSFGVAAFFAYYPLIMRHSYGIPPEVTALAYAAAAGVGVFLFVAAGRLALRHGSRVVFQAGVALRLTGFFLLGLPFVLMLPWVRFIALAGFLLVMLAWPVISVSGTALAARLTPVSEGAAIGLLNAAGALATVAGTFTGGPLVHAWGYGVVTLLAIAGLGVAELLMLGLGSGPSQLSPATCESAEH